MSIGSIVFIIIFTLIALIPIVGLIFATAGHDILVAFDDGKNYVLNKGKPRPQFTWQYETSVALFNKYAKKPIFMQWFFALGAKAAQRKVDNIEKINSQLEERQSRLDKMINDR